MGQGGAEALPRVAVVGCGLWGRNHVRNHAGLGSLAAVVDRHPERADALAREHGVPARSLDDVLADPTIEACVFALPPSQNLPLGRRVLEAGKHLFVEKPLALTSQEGTELCRLAAERDRRLMVGHILHYHPAFEALRALVDRGDLGDILSVVSTRLDLGRIRREEDALWALGTHDVSMVLRLVGSEPADVSAEAGRFTHPAIADTVTATLVFPGGVRAEIRSSWLNPFKEQKLVVVGRSGMAVFDDRAEWPGKLTLLRYRLDESGAAPTIQRGEPEAVALEPGEPLRRECLHFLQSIRSGKRPRTDGQEGLRVLRVLERASAAAKRS